MPLEEGKGLLGLWNYLGYLCKNAHFWAPPLILEFPDQKLVHREGSFPTFFRAGFLGECLVAVSEAADEAGGGVWEFHPGPASRPAEESGPCLLAHCSSVSCGPASKKPL